MECHEEAVSSQATQLTATVVGVAMSTLAGEQNPGSVPTVSHNGVGLATMQFSLSRWKAEEMRQKQRKLTSSRTQLTQTRLCDTRRED